MTECFQRHVNGIAESLNFIGRQLSWKYYLAETHVLKETRTFRCAGVALGACVQRYGRDIKTQQCHVLHDKGIGACMIKFGNESLYISQFAVIYDSVDCSINLGSILVCEISYASEVIYGIGSGRTCSVARRTHIHRIGSVKYGLNRSGSIAGGSKQLKLTWR